MKYLLWVVVAFLIPGTVQAGNAGGNIGVYPDETASYCSAVDTPGPKTLYVIHKFSTGHNGSRFRIELSSGFDGTLVSASVPQGTFTGDPITGVTVNYGSCLAGTFIVMELHFLMSGASPECSWVRTAAHPLSIDGSIDAYNCNSVRVSADWGGTHIQHNISLYCSDLTTLDGGDVLVLCKPYTPPVPTAQSTWGAVKSLYR